jgi:hypothetical protein
LDPSIGLFWAAGTCSGISDLTFMTAHFLLAWKYKEVANVVPKVLKKLVPQEKNKSQKMLFLVLLALNIAVPVAEIFAYSGFHVAQIN